MDGKREMIKIEKPIRLPSAPLQSLQGFFTRIRKREVPPVFASKKTSYAFAFLVLVGCTGLAKACAGFLELTNLLMIYLIGILIVVFKTGKGPSTFACVLGVLSFDFFMVPPRFAFAPTDSQYLITLLVVLAITLSINELMDRTRFQTEAIRLKESRTAALYSLSCKLAASQKVDLLLNIAQEHIGQIMDSRAAILLPGKDGNLTPRNEGKPKFSLDPQDQKTADWVFRSGEITGSGEEAPTGAKIYFFPLTASGKPVGVLGIRPSHFLSAEQHQFLQSLANQIGASLENARLAEESQKSRLRIETEQLRNALLSSVSHDLRTPLAVITGSASSLLEQEPRLSGKARGELIQDIYDESERLNHLLTNLLEMTKLSTEKIHLKKELQPLEEMVGSALYRLEKKLGERPVLTLIPEDLPMLPLDSILMEQVFINLIENGIKYTPAGSPIEISARPEGPFLRVEISDEGPGLESGDEDRIFDKFYRGPKTAGQSGVGLGLSICRNIVEAHGGRIEAKNRSKGGAVFSLLLPFGIES
jgi:two-component system sensor histidine kinase KdpD